MAAWTDEILGASLNGRICVWRDGQITLKPRKEVPWM